MHNTFHRPPSASVLSTNSTLLHVNSRHEYVGRQAEGSSAADYVTCECLQDSCPPTSFPSPRPTAANRKYHTRCRSRPILFENPDPPILDRASPQGAAECSSTNARLNILPTR